MLFAMPANDGMAFSIAQQSVEGKICELIDAPVLNEANIRPDSETPKLVS